MADSQGVNNTDSCYRSEDEEDDIAEQSEEEEESENETNVSTKEQKEIMKKLEREQPSFKEGDSWYLLDITWWKRWREYVGYDEYSSSAYQFYASYYTKPGQIDNSKLLEPGSNLVRRHLYERQNFVIISEQQWEKLISWYGGGPAIARPVVKCDSNLFVEIRDLEILFVRSTARTKANRVAFSKAATIGTVIKKACDLYGLKDDSIRLWNYSDQVQSKLYENKEKTLYHYQVAHSQYVLVEEKQANGEWPPKPQPKTSSYYGWGSSSSYDYNSRGKDPTDPGKCGLANLGNTCFMNSSLQSLSNFPLLTGYFLSGAYRKEINRDNLLGTQGKLVEEFASLMRDIWSGEYKYIAPRSFKSKLEKFAPQFQGGNQHDSQELLAYLLDGLHEDLNRVKKKPYVELKESDGRLDEIVAKEAWENHLLRNDSVIVDFFHGQLKSTLVCPDCERISVTFDPLAYLQLPLPMKMTRDIDILFIPETSEILPTKYRVSVPKAGTIKDFKNEIEKLVNSTVEKKEEKDANGKKSEENEESNEQVAAQLTEFISAADLIVTEIGFKYFRKIYQDQQPIESINEYSSTIYVYHVKQNPNDPEIEEEREREREKEREKEKEREREREKEKAAQMARYGYMGGYYASNHYYSSMNSYNTTNQYTSGPPDEYINVPVVFRKEVIYNYGYGSSKVDFNLFGVPFFINVKRGITYREALEICMEKIQRLISKEEQQQYHSQYSMYSASRQPMYYNQTSSTSNNNNFHSSSSSSHMNRGSNLHRDDDEDEDEDDDDDDDDRPNALEDSDSNDDDHIDARICLNNKNKRQQVGHDDDDDNAEEENEEEDEEDDEEEENQNNHNIYKVQQQQHSHVRRIENQEEEEEENVNGNEDELTEEDGEEEKGEEENEEEDEDDTEEGEDETANDYFLMRIVDIQGARVIRTLEYNSPINFRDKEALALDWSSEYHSKYYKIYEENNVQKHISCKSTTDNEQSFTIFECLDLFSAKEKLSPDDLWYCNKCKEHKQATKSIDLWKLPPVLVVHLKRFSYRKSLYRDKLEALVEFPLNDLDLRKYQKYEGGPEAVYDLVAVSNHMGGLSGGHYTAYAKNVNDGNWYEFNDSNVYQVSPSKVCSSSAYVLLYRRKDTIALDAKYGKPLKYSEELEKNFSEQQQTSNPENPCCSSTADQQNSSAPPPSNNQTEKEENENENEAENKTVGHTLNVGNLQNRPDNTDSLDDRDPLTPRSFAKSHHQRVQSTSTGGGGDSDAPDESGTSACTTTHEENQPTTTQGNEYRSVEGTSLDNFPDPTGATSSVDATHSNSEEQSSKPTNQTLEPNQESGVNVKDVATSADHSTNTTEAG